MNITLRVQRLDKPELVAYNRILRRYGAGCFSQEPQDRKDHWRVPIGAFLESRVTDKKTERERNLTFKLEDVGQILVKKSTMRVMEATHLRSLRKNILRRRADISRLVEQDIIKILGNPSTDIRFSALRYAFQGLQPIYRTLNRLLLEDYPTFNELMDSGRHYLDQVDLLTDIGYAKYEGRPARLVETDKIKDLYENTGDMERTVDIVLGMILSEFYYDLKKGKRIGQFMPYIRASTGYYGDAIQFGKLISITEDQLCKNVTKYYGGMSLPPRLRFGYPTMIKEMVNAKILDYDGKFITGREKIFDSLIDVRNDLPITEEPVSFGE